MTTYGYTIRIFFNNNSSGKSTACCFMCSFMRINFVIILID